MKKHAMDSHHSVNVPLRRISPRRRCRNREKLMFTRTLPAVLVLLATDAAPLAAQESDLRFEITPFTAYRVGGDFQERDGSGQVALSDSDSQGVMFNIKAHPNGQYELLYARQSTEADTRDIMMNDSTFDIDVEYFHFGGTYLFDGDNTRPFIALTLGLSQFDPAIPGSDSESFFSASFGGGIHLNAGKRFGVRLEARAFTTFVDSDSNIFCVSLNGVGSCLIQVDARTLTQWEARAGLVFRF